MPYSQDETTKMIMETFPGSQVVASAPAEQAPRVAAQARQAAPPSNPPARPQQANTGPRRAPAAPAKPAELWQELFDYPGDWFWNEKKENANAADFMSTKYYKDDGWPVSLWIESRFPGQSCPDVEYLNAMDGNAFAQQRPRKRD